jgi:protein-L-isoaspartate O-methyltransferase
MTTTDEAFQLHQALVDQLIAAGTLRTPSVEAAFRAVPPHLFLPAVSLEEVYRVQAIVTKRAAGISVSSSSQPAIMTVMLEQLDVQPGPRVLEIGAGTGYNAPLLGQLVGATGQVISVDIDPDIVESARQHLDAGGFARVQVIRGDGGLGHLDFPHAVEHLTAAAQPSLGVGTPTLTAWLDEQAHTLKHAADGAGQVLAALARLPVHAAADPMSAVDARDGVMAYFTKRLMQVQDATFQAAGYPIGSGSSESANKMVVEARLKGSGMHWARAHVDPLAALRTLE